MCHRDAAHLAIWLAAGALLSVGNNGLAAIVTTHDAATLAEALGASNSGFTVMESIYSGDPLAAAVQTTGTGGIGRGILLTTGAASDAVGPSSNLASRNNGRPGVSFLEHVAGAPGNSGRDATILMLNLRAGPNVIGGSFDYVFATEEMPGSGYDDAFGARLFGAGSSSVNFALDAAGNAITVSRAQFAPANDGTSSFNYHTARATVTFSVVPGEEFKLMFMIADIGSGTGDSGIYLADFQALAVPEPKAATLLAAGLCLIALHTLIRSRVRRRID